MSYANGRIPQSALLAVPGGYLEREAGYAYIAEINEAKRLGLASPASGGDGLYRNYGQQVYRRALYESGAGPLAAVPGTSVHGDGRAKDNNTGEHSTDDRIGVRYGWHWGDVPSESWHTQYHGGYIAPPLGPPTLGRPGKAAISRGAWIVSYTRGMLYLGYLHGEPREFFTKGVEQATGQFQRNHKRFGLKDTGIVDAKTLGIFRTAVRWRQLHPH